MKTKITIRKATEIDATNILDFVKAVTNESIFLGRHNNDSLPDLETEQKLIKEAPADDLWLLALVDEKIVGLLNFSREHHIKSKHRSSFGISVRKSYWGQGIASMLMEAMLKHAYSLKGLEKIELGVNSTNDKAIVLYKKYNFKEEGRIGKALLVDGEYYDEIKMALFL